MKVELVSYPISPAVFLAGDRAYGLNIASTSAV